MPTSSAQGQLFAVLRLLIDPRLSASSMSASVRENTASDAVAYHGQLAVDWEERYQKRSFQERVRVLDEILAGRDLNGRQWLDAGCGTGTLARNLAARGCRVLGVDAAEDMVQVAGRLSEPAVAALVKFAHVSTIAQLPLSSASQDGVLCSSVLEYVQDPGECLAEFSRVLRPGGLLAVSVPNGNSFVRWMQLGTHRWGKSLGRRWVKFLDYSCHEFSEDDFRGLLAQHGFETVKVIPFGSPIPRWLQRKSFGGSLLMFLAVRESKQL